MVATITYPPTGRRAWNSEGVGGTLSSDGTRLGGFLAVAVGGVLPLVGRVGYMADRYSQSCDINAYAVWRHVKAVQIESGIIPEECDGIYGNVTKAAVKARQLELGISNADGVVGPTTAKAMWRPKAIAAAKAVTDKPDLPGVLCGHLSYEGGWDPGAVGGTTPEDIGLAQINEVHGLSVEARCDPLRALPWAAKFVLGNFVALNWVTDDAIAAYNLGQGGARAWRTAGRPDEFARTINGKVVMVKVRRYIDEIKARST